MEEKVLEILKRVFELENVDTTFSQETCEKWDSMSQLNLIVELESEFDISIEPDEIDKLKSYNDIVKVIREIKQK